MTDAHSTYPCIAGNLADKAMTVHTVCKVRAIKNKPVSLVSLGLAVLLGVISVTLYYYSYERTPGFYLGTVADSSRVDSADVLGVPHTSVDPETHDVAQFVVTCSFVRSLPVDPVVLSRHEHAFFGNKEVGTGSASDVKDALTSCAVPTDTASYWAPTVVKNGESMLPDRMIAYYRKGIGVTSADINPYPPDFFMLSGPSTDIKASFWKCASSIQSSLVIPACGPDDSLTMVVVFPDCWDGVNIDSTGHRAHVRYSRKGICPQGHPEHIPQLLMKVVYGPTDYDPANYTLSSGGLRPHADFLNTWDQTELKKLVLTCLVRDQVCPRH